MSGFANEPLERRRRPRSSTADNGDLGVRVFELTHAERELGEVARMLKGGRGGAWGPLIAGEQGMEQAHAQE